MGAPIPRLSTLGCQTKGEQPGGSACLRRGRGRQVGDGRNKSPSCFAVREGSVCITSRGESIACARRGASGQRGVLLLSFWPCPARLWRLLIPKLGSRQRRAGRKMHNSISLLMYTARKKQRPPVRRRHWPASFLWSSPANAGLCCLYIDSSDAGGLHLFVCFPRPPPYAIFWLKNRLFSAFATHLCGSARQAWGKAIFCPTTTSLPSNSCKQRKRLRFLKSGLTTDAPADMVCQNDFQCSHW